MSSEDFFNQSFQQPTATRRRNAGRPGPPPPPPARSTNANANIAVAAPRPPSSSKIAPSSGGNKLNGLGGVSRSAVSGSSGYYGNGSSLNGVGVGSSTSSRPTGNYYPTTSASASASSTAPTATLFPAYHAYGTSANTVNTANVEPAAVAPNPYGGYSSQTTSSTPAAAATVNNAQADSSANDDDWFSHAQNEDNATINSNNSSNAGSVTATATASTNPYMNPYAPNNNAQHQQRPDTQAQTQAPSTNQEPIGTMKPMDPTAFFGSMNSFASAGSNQSTPGVSSYNSYDFENEPPLLEELGINIDHIKTKSLAVILPFRYAKSVIDTSIMEDNDMAGPLAFGLLLALELLLAGKIHFGYIYGFGLFGTLATTLFLNLMSPSDSISVWTVVSILGYSLLPVNMLAAVNVFYRIQYMGNVGVVLAAVTIGWCTLASTRLVERGCGMREQRFLIGYPNALLYSAFVMLTIF